MTTDPRPLSQLVSQGWEVVSYSPLAGSEGHVDCFLLRRQKQHKILKVRRKVIGGGYVVRESDV
ncbi:hypothetical protein BH11PSE2_BH11PSE2_02690 [soil metagenome]